MMADRPEIQKGYLGPQSKFAEFGLSAVSHPDPEINIDANQVIYLFTHRDFSLQYVISKHCFLWFFFANIYIL